MSENQSEASAQSAEQTKPKSSPDSVAATDAGDADNLSVTAEYEIPAPTSRSVPFLSLLALLIAFAAVTATGFLWWQYRQFYVSLADADQATETSMERIRASVRATEDAISRVDTAATNTDRAMRDFDDRLGVLPGQIATVERRIDAIQGGSFDVRSQWLQAEAEYYLGVANAELQLANRWDGALMALRFADDRLREIADPALAPVRELIADEIIALTSVRLIDVEGLSYSLGRLSARAAGLPLRSATPSDYGAAAGQADEEPGFARLWSSIKGALTSIVRVERRDAPITAALSIDEQRLIRRQLSVELQVARLALIRAEPDTFQASLEAADALLRDDFDMQQPDVQGGLALIDELLSVDIAPAAPDISRSLLALRARGAQ